MTAPQELRSPAPGAQVYTDPSRHRGHDEKGTGGILVEVIGFDYHGDDPYPRRVFKVWDPAGAGAYRTVYEEDCGPDSVTGMDITRTTLAVTQMLTQYLKARGRSGRKLLAVGDVDLIRHAWLLVRAITGGER